MNDFGNIYIVKTCYIHYTSLTSKYLRIKNIGANGNLCLFKPLTKKCILTATKKK